LVIGFIVLSQKVTTSNCGAIAYSHTLQFTTARLYLLSLLCLLRLSRNDFQRRRFLSFRVQRLRSSLAVACLTTQLGVECLHSSNNGYFSRPYGSRAALANRRLKTPDSCDYTSQITITHRLAFPLTVFTTLLGNFFQQWMFLCSRAHCSAGWRPPTALWLASNSQLARRTTMGPPTPPPGATLSV
jgi:hypothetical protein